MSVSLETRYLESFVRPHELGALQPQVTAAHELLHAGSGLGSDFLGWLTLPTDYDKEEFARIQAAAARIRQDTDIFIAIGIGGSYLGARAAIEFLKSPLYNAKKKDTPDVYFAGNSISSAALSELLELCEGRRVSINVISKSGTTTEPAIAFRVFRDYLEKTVGREEAKKRIYVTTDKARGTLKGLADREGYETFVVPDDVGGRFSVLTAVGLLPIAAAGIDIEALMSGARDAMERLSVPGMDNPAWQYAAARHALYSSGKRIEILAAYEPAFRFFGEWWKQLFGESEGKEGKGLFPASVEFTADLHSMGQYIQQGQRLMLETVVRFAPGPNPVVIPEDKDNVDGLNFLAGKSLDFVAEQAMRGTILAHVDGGVPNLMVEADALSAHTAGELIYFFEYTCGLSGYLLGVNPFDQPGVEAYKKNMFALLGKPGYEEQKAALEARL